MSKANESQIGGSHYKGKILQHWDVPVLFGLNYLDGVAVNYILRAGSKGSRVEDLEKAAHVLQKILEVERLMQGCESAESREASYLQNLSKGAESPTVARDGDFNDLDAPPAIDPSIYSRGRLGGAA